MLAMWVQVQITGMQKPTEEEIHLFPLQFNSSTGRYQPTELLNHWTFTILYSFTGVAFWLGWMVCMDPVMCECVWLMIVVVCVCRLGEKYGCECVWVWVSWGGGQEGYIFCLWARRQDRTFWTLTKWKGISNQTTSRHHGECNKHKTNMWKRSKTFYI